MNSTTSTAMEWMSIETCPKNGTPFLAKEGDDIYKCCIDPSGKHYLSFCGQPTVHPPKPTQWKPL